MPCVRQCPKPTAKSIAHTWSRRKGRGFTCACNICALSLRKSARSGWSGPSAFSRIPIALRNSASASSSLPCVECSHDGQCGGRCSGKIVSFSSTPDPRAVHSGPYTTGIFINGHPKLLLYFHHHTIGAAKNDNAPQLQPKIFCMDVDDVDDERKCLHL